MFLNNAKLYVKLGIIPVVVLITSVFTMIRVNGTIKNNEQLMRNIVNGYVPAWENSSLLLETLEQIQYSLHNAVAAEDMDELAVANAHYQTLVNLLGVQTKIAQEMNVINVTEIRELSDMLKVYFSLSRDNAARMIKGETGEQMIWELESMTKQYNEIKERLKDNNNTDKTNMTNSLRNALDRNEKTWAILLITMIISLVIIWGIAVYIIVGISKPLKMAIHVIERVSEGDLSVQAYETTSRDEIGILMRSFNAMVNTLRNLTTQIKEAANSLATAASEISASVTQIASSATETATAANETSTTVEEVRQTALDSNRKSKHVSESAQKAVQVSQTGEKSVSETIEDMHRIEQQMDSIAQSIMKLSEHGQAIGGIIATVEDVAEQSNLLAVNASIEAAKAGEQGKGFAVVAQEVKSLAEQSRQATLKVRQILDDIQKSTSGAVMTTEQGSKAVEAGAVKSKEAGDSIQRLAASVAEAAQATTQISVSSQEQLVGMDQVVSAMESIKQASTQNVTATKQVESAARDLHELGQKLKQLVEQYIV